MTGALLEMDAVNFGYGHGSRPVLGDLSAQFESGTTTAVVGPSGSGKSTVMYLLGLMLRPTSGRILLRGERCDDAPDHLRADLRAREFGFVFQDAALDPGRSVLDNIAESALYRRIPRSRVRGRAAELLERFGVDVPVDRKPGQMSGGQAQRIALCRALLGKPSIVLADEPTGNLDPKTGATVLEALREHAEEGGVAVIVSHDPEIAAACERRLELGG